MRGAALQPAMAKINTSAPTHRELTNRGTSLVYEKIHGDAMVQAPSSMFSQLKNGSPAGFDRRIIAKIAINAPTIQLFHALGSE